jgi:Ser/Thr protein kinase RdoA (MazF antagonist)
MDNAGGGRRGLRASPSAGLLELVSQEYGIDPPATAIDLGGSANLNLLLDSGAQRLVLRVYRPYVTPSRLDTIQGVRRALFDAGLPCHGLVPTRDGRPWVRYAGRCVELEHYVAHDATMDSLERLHIALPVLGRMHTVLGRLNVNTDGLTAPFANAIAPEEVVERSARGTARIRSWNPTPEEHQLAAQADALAQQVAQAERTYSEALPRQLVHGDFWDSNVLLRGDRVVYIADFDFLAERARIDDLALTLYFACLSFFDASVSDTQLGRLRRLLDAYDEGSEPPLSAVERAALPLALARQPLWSIGVWVASLDEVAAARRHAAGMHQELRWALRLMAEIDRWQSALS